MKSLILILVIAIVCATAISIPDEEYAKEFVKFTRKYNRDYETQQEGSKRFRIFKQNYEKITKHNSDKTKTWSNYSRS